MWSQRLLVLLHNTSDSQLDEIVVFHSVRLLHDQKDSSHRPLTCLKKQTNYGSSNWPLFMVVPFMYRSHWIEQTGKPFVRYGKCPCPKIKQVSMPGDPKRYLGYHFPAEHLNESCGMILSELKK